MCFVIVRENEKAVVEQLGKYSRTLEPGFHFLVPFVERAITINVAQRAEELGMENIITKDNLSVNMSGYLFYKVIEPKKAIYDVDDYKYQLINITKTAIRAAVGKYNFETVNQMKDPLEIEVIKEIRKGMVNTGVEVIKVELKEIEVPPEIQEDLNLVTSAVAEKRQTIIKSEGEAEAIKNLGAAYNTTLQPGSGALKAKELETIQESMKNGTKMVIGGEGGTGILNVLGEDNTTTLVGTKPKKRVKKKSSKKK